MLIDDGIFMESASYKITGFEKGLLDLLCWRCFYLYPGIMILVRRDSIWQPLFYLGLFITTIFGLPNFWKIDATLIFAVTL